MEWKCVLRSQKCFAVSSGWNLVQRPTGKISCLWFWKRWAHGSNTIFLRGWDFSCNIHTKRLHILYHQHLSRNYFFIFFKLWWNIHNIKFSISITSLRIQFSGAEYLHTVVPPSLPFTSRTLSSFRSWKLWNTIIFNQLCFIFGNCWIYYICWDLLKHKCEYVLCFI